MKAAVFWVAVCAVFGVASVWLYHPVLELPFDIDDRAALLDNEQVEGNLGVILTGVYHPTGRPMGHLVRWILYRVNGNDLSAYHALSVFLHVVNGLITVLLARAFGWPRRVAFVSGFLFIISVAPFKAVHHVAALEYLLAAGFSGLGLVHLLAGLRTNKIWRFALFTLLMLASVASHVASVALIPVCGLVVWVRWHDVRRWVMHMGPLVVLAGAMVTAVLVAATGNDIPTTTGRSAWRVLDEGILSTGFVTIRMYTWFVSQLFTHGFAMPMAPYTVTWWQSLIGGTLAAVGISYAAHRIRSPEAIAILCCLAALAPFSMQAEATIVAVPGPSRYLYLATMGFCLLVASLLARLATRSSTSAVVLTGALVVSSGFAQQEAISLSQFTAGRAATIRGQLEDSVRLLSCSMVAGRGVLPMNQAYGLLLSSQVELDPEQARVSADSLLLLDPDNAFLSFVSRLLVSVTVNANEDTSLAADLQRLGRPELSAPLLTALARHQTGRGGYESALGNASLALAQDPQLLKARYLRGGLLLTFRDLRGLDDYVEGGQSELAGGRPASMVVSRFRPVVEALRLNGRAPEALNYLVTRDSTPASESAAILQGLLNRASLEQ